MNELAYVLINPYTMSKSRTGGVISRLLSRSSSLRLLGARMFAPSKELVEEYIETLTVDEQSGPEQREVELLVREYVRTHYLPDAQGQRQRVMFLLVEGEDAVACVRDEVVGSIIRQTVGETIRDTYGDFIKDAHGRLVYFEPAVLIARTVAQARRQIDVWLKHSTRDSGILHDAIKYPAGVTPEHTLVMFKPDTLAHSRTRMGTVVDLFAKTGLFVIAIKIIHISVAQAMEFYGPVRDIFVEKFADKVRDKAFAALQGAFEFPISVAVAEHLAQELKTANADHEFGKIVQFMTGRNPWQTPQADWPAPGSETCLALVYQGVDAVNKIREQLGSTDPRKAAPATVRKEFGRDVMVNTAHASDSAQNAAREIRIIDLAANDLPALVANFYGA
ncbi:MAG: nucleoside-diphosphate kinase [bacterium]|nr:nucleoside-diphosphate kinase [bacterium]